MAFQPKEAFAREVSKDESQLNLAYAALLLSACLAQGFNVNQYLDRMAAMAEAVRGPVSLARSDREIVASLNRYLFSDLQFYGNSQEYYHPDNSFLNKVLDQRRGIPISLSVIYLTLGWRLGLPVWGIGLPGHFIVGYGQPAEPIYIDVFNQGKILSEEECLELSRVPQVNRAFFKQEFLKPVAKKAILLRMLLNLKQIYVGTANWAAAYQTIDLILLVRPDLAGEVRDRGLIAYKLHQLQEAVFDLKRYLFLAPTSPDADQLRQQLEVMEQELLRLN